MTFQGMVHLVLHLQELRAWFEEDVSDTIEGQAAQTLIDYLIAYLEQAKIRGLR
jgi:hypothetical protein